MDLSRPDRSERLDALAAQYALGTLSPRARRRMARAARSQPAVARAISAWEMRLATLAEAIPGVTPPPRVWEGIRTRLGMAETLPPRGSWWSSLGFWRGLAFASLAAVVAFTVALLAGRPGEPSAIVVVLAGQDGKPALVATANRDGRVLTVKSVAPVEVAAGRTLELWALPQGANPRSLGLIPATGVGKLTLPDEADVAFQGTPALAVSLEPSGGSPTGLPTGPVLYSGPVSRLY
jgi:anti-sigma-K factor RskA